MRFVRVVLAFVFGLAMAGPETHACPVHEQHASPAAHHEQTPSDQSGSEEHCTCPQACCPVGIGVSLPPASDSWLVAPRLTGFTVVTTSHALFLAPRQHVLPFALAPPRTLA